MKNIWYTLLETFTRVFGSWFFALVSRMISAGYFLFSKNSKESHRFYSLLYPQENGRYHKYCTFRQYQNFTTIHYDRFLTAHGRNATFHSQGLDKLDSLGQENGAILLMSHLGNWEMAAHLLKQQKMQKKLLLYMGVKEKEGLKDCKKHICEIRE